jgi:hypothetical protein
MPTCVYLNSERYLYIGNKLNGRIVRYSPNNTQDGVADLISDPQSIDINHRNFGMDLDDNLNIYISEYNNHRFVKWLAPTYKNYLVVAGNGSSGSKMNQLKYPRGIYLDQTNNDLYIVYTLRMIIIC